MTLDCIRCRKTIDFSGDRPNFCPYCGANLSTITSGPPTDHTSPYVHVDAEATTQSGAPGEPGTDDVPTHVGGYRLVRLLGSGGMGAVYEGVTEDSGQQVAVKLISTPGRAAEGALERFRQEGRLASLISHPNCVFVLRADEEAGQPFIVMELMPGETLRDLVRDRGPLPSAEAVAKILNVIDGLIEAHKLNILHRDVKPSNCFLMADGRVKVGDFGLSKSLSTGSDLNLTRTGSFLGTVLYASPEQIKGEAVDYSADVYSVCATLYYLLTGQAPFQHENPTVVISRVISEDPPDICKIRPDVPRPLRDVVMRGLARNASDRWSNLTELRTALDDLVGRPLSRGSVGTRLTAFAIDVVAIVILFVINPWPFLLGHWIVDAPTLGQFVIVFLALVLPSALYFGLWEGLAGYTPGKWCLRLRVCDAESASRPDWRRIAIRTLVFVGLVDGLGWGIDLLGGSEFGNPMSDFGTLVSLIGMIAPIVTMRSRNGLRGLHEFASGTRVVQLPWKRPTRPIEAVLDRSAWPSPTADSDLPTSIGGYLLHGVVSRTTDAFLIHGTDPTLGRDVHLWGRRRGHGPSDARRAVARPTRCRWLAGGQSGDWSWDAFLAPNGAPLDQVVRRCPLPWPETLSILDQLSEELTAARGDGSLPGPVTASDVWVRPDGRAMLCDPPAPAGVADDRGELIFFNDLAATSLEGKPRDPDAPPLPIRAFVPLHAGRVLSRLSLGEDMFLTHSQLREALAEAQPRPGETSSPMRLAHIGLQGVLLAPWFALILTLVGLYGACRPICLSEGYLLMSEARDDLVKKTASLAAGDPIRVQSNNRARSQLTAEVAAIESYAANADFGLNAAERKFARVYEQYFIGLPSVHFADWLRLLSKDAVEHAARGDSGVFNCQWEPVVAGRVASRVSMVVLGIAVGWIVWAFVFRGGIAYRIAGLVLVRSDGRKAARWQAALRCMLVWAPFVAVVLACLQAKLVAPQYVFVHNMLWLLAVLLLLAYVVIGLFRPSRGWHDRLSGVAVVPR